MGSTDDTGSSPPDEGTGRTPSRMRQLLGGSRGVIRIAYRDPEHVSERLTLYAIDRLAAPSREWVQSVRAAQPETPPAEIAETLRTRTAQIARIDGAISGTPFLLALLPGYMTYLLQEMRMTLRIAALYDRDPGDLSTAAEMLALRGVHPDVETARAALLAVQETAMPDRPPERRPLRHWIHSGYLLLVFGGFMSPASAERPQGFVELVRAAASLLVGTAIWLMTWVLPLTFMIMMAWGCETHARQLGRRALIFYGGEAASTRAAIAAAARRHDRGHDKRALIRSVALFVSVALPIGFVAYANHVRNSVGVNWLVALGALVAFSLVIATVVLANRS
jgi:hypothetical protein